MLLAPIDSCFKGYNSVISDVSSSLELRSVDGVPIADEDKTDGA